MTSEPAYGVHVNLSDSICRARHRGYRTDPDPVESGEVYEFYTGPYPTANVSKAGHSIRLDVSSSNFCQYDVNRNTGESLSGGRDYEVARNTVHHRGRTRRTIELPVRPTG